VYSELTVPSPSFQAGPLQRVTIPKDKATGKQKNFAFITFKHELSVPFCINIFDGVYLLKRRLQIKTRNGSIHTCGKNPVDPDKWGIGLLPHPSKGCGIIKARNPPANKFNSRNGHSSDSSSQSDQDNNNGEDYDTRRVVIGNPGILMPPPGPPAMGYPPPQGMPAHALGYQGQNPGQRNFQRSQTWPGILELPENNTNSDSHDSQRMKHKYEDRFNESRDVSRDSRDTKRRRFEENPRDREDGRRVVHDEARHGQSRSSRNGDHQRSFDRGDGPVDIHQMAALQMQMIQQQQRGFGGSTRQQSGSSSSGYRRY
jgi:RNA recognition motif-containing protein